MLDQRYKDLIAQGDKLFAKRQGLDSLWQEIGDQFYPERAFFTVGRGYSEQFADHLTTSYPIVTRRELGNTFSAMLRPKDAEWFYIKAAREDRTAGDDTEGRGFLEWATGTMRRAMYDIESGFVRATKEGDHDFAAFGQCVISPELSREGDGLLYRCWHIKNVVWKEGLNGRPNAVHRKDKMDLLTARAAFRDNVAQEVKTKITTEPLSEIDYRHIVVPAEEFDGPYLGKGRTPYVSCYIDMTNQHVMEVVGSWTLRYVIPRWQTVSGSQYGYSPATVAGLPDARLLQAMTLSLLEAGEKAADPPLVATSEVVRNVDTRAGGVSWVDDAYDERLGEALRPMTIDRSGLSYGVEMHDRVRVALAEAFFLNKLSMPPAGSGEMTAFEVGQRIQEYIRNALPIFEPVEADYNGELCEQTFEIMLRAGAFGRPQDIPESLQGQEITFRFESPLSEMIERRKGQQWIETMNLTAATAQLDPTVANIPDAKTALRDVLKGIGTPAAWLRSEEAAQALEEQQKQAMEAMGQMQALEQGAGAAKDAAAAAKSGAEAAEMAGMMA